MTDSISDAERNHSMQMNAAKAENAVKNEGGAPIVFIGNSIILHERFPEIGGLNVWEWRRARQTGTMSIS